MNIKNGTITDNNLRLKEKIRLFWDKKPCGTFGVFSDDIDRDYFDKIRERRYRLEPFIKEAVGFEKLKSKKVLEIGCGVGADGIEFALAGADYTGIDASQKSLELAKKNFQFNKMKANLELADAENLPFSNDIFDFVYSWGVLHHTPDMEKAINEVYRVLKPGGSFCIMLYNRYSLVGLQLYILYGLIRLKPFISLNYLFDKYHESPGTKAITDKEAYLFFKNFRNIEIKNIVTPYDVRIGRNRYLPKFIMNFIPSNVGFFKVITGKK